MNRNPTRWHSGGACHHEMVIHLGFAVGVGGPSWSREGGGVRRMPLGCQSLRGHGLAVMVQVPGATQMDRLREMSFSTSHPLGANDSAVPR